jgi:hypothetical protein
MEHIEVRIKGKVDAGWSDWLGGLTVSHTAEGETILTGNLRDQSALLGVLNRLPDLGLRLLSVKSRKIDDNPGDNKMTIQRQVK